MPLLDRLRELENFPSSHQPALHEVLTLVGKLIAFVEHGDKLFEQEDSQGLSDLLSGTRDEPADVTAPAAGDPPVSAPAPTAAPAPPATSPLGVGVPGGASSTDDRDAEIASLRQQLETLRAQQGRTEATVEPAGTTATVEPAS